jgi:CBS-domain-containing membrane protein
MKKQTMILLGALLAFPAFAQTTNEVVESQKKDRVEHHKRAGQKSSEAERRLRQERKYHFMDKALTELGIDEEDREKIHALQEQHRQNMKRNAEHLSAARKELSELQASGATEAELDSAIRKIADLHAQQLKILVGNRLEMEKILGKEAYARLMDSARIKFREHGRRGGPGLPPRPFLPVRKEPRGKNPPVPME